MTLGWVILDWEIILKHSPALLRPVLHVFGATLLTRTFSLISSRVISCLRVLNQGNKTNSKKLTSIKFIQIEGILELLAGVQDAGHVRSYLVGLGEQGRHVQIGLAGRGVKKCTPTAGSF